MTISEKQREAIRINGQKGGPRTENIFKMNAVSHSLTAGLNVLGVEDKPRFQTMLEAYVAELQPVGIEENDLVEEIVVGKWRQKRLWGVESSVHERAMREADEALELISRYEDRARRLHQTARKDLDRLQSARKLNSEPASQIPEAPKVTMQSLLSQLARPYPSDWTNEPKSNPIRPKIDRENEPKEPKAA